MPTALKRRCDQPSVPESRMSISYLGQVKNKHKTHFLTREELVAFVCMHRCECIRTCGIWQAYAAKLNVCAHTDGVRPRVCGVCMAVFMAVCVALSLSDTKLKAIVDGRRGDADGVQLRPARL